MIINNFLRGKEGVEGQSQEWMVQISTDIAIRNPCYVAFNLDELLASPASAIPPEGPDWDVAAVTRNV